MSILAEEQEISLTEDEKKLAGDAASEYYESLNDEEKSFMGLSPRSKGRQVPSRFR